MKRHVLAGLVMLLLASPVWAQSSTTPGELEAIKSDLGRVKADIEEIKRQLGQILRLMQQRSAPSGAAPLGGAARARVADAPTLGLTDAPVTVVEFSDYQCPFCGRFYSTTLPALKRDYIDTGKVRYVFRDYPLDQIHPQARKAAEAAHCAGDQGKYWEMHDRLSKISRRLRLRNSVSTRARSVSMAPSSTLA